MLHTGHVLEVFPCQLAQMLELDRVLHDFPRPVSRRRTGSDYPSALQGNQVPIQARAGNACGIRELTGSTWPHQGQVPENVGLRAVSNHAHCGLNLRGQIGLDESGHTPILPDAINPLRVTALPYY